MRSPSPRASSISVEVDLIVMTRFGAAPLKSTVVPQLSTVRVEADGCGACAAAVGAQPTRARAASAAMARTPPRRARTRAGRKERTDTGLLGVGMAVIIRGHYWPTGELPRQVRGRCAAPHPARGSVFQS